MPDFIIAYRAGSGSGDRAAFRTWLASLGEAVVNPGTPLSSSKAVSAGGVAEAGAERLVGFSVVRAPDMEAALEMAKTCPYLEVGMLEVAQMMEM